MNMFLCECNSQSPHVLFRGAQILPEGSPQLVYRLSSGPITATSCTASPLKQRRQHRTSNSIPAFLTGARYQATDSLKPSWSAAYDIESAALFSHPSYTHLRANRSPREGALVVRLETLDRRTCETLDQTSAPPNADQAPQYVLTIADNEKGKLKAFEGVKGWRRSHRHEIYDSLNMTHGKGVQNEASKFAVIHEFDDESYVKTDAFKQATEGRREVRRWKLYKATPNTAPTKQ